jgi:NAD(P)-dependent dehydrogenase (short-subunit alcohol dehydrogenase family)
MSTTNSPFDLSGKAALITGGASGIGLGMASALGAAGATVVLWDVSETSLKNATAELESAGCTVTTQLVDVSSEAAVAAAMGELLDRHGRLDAAFANAGITRPASLLEVDQANLDKTLSTNLYGVVFTLREAARHMVQRAEGGDRGGSLVATASLSAVTAHPANISYSASKAAVLSVIRSVAVGFAPYGVRANAIIPGWIRTPLTASTGKDGFYDKVIQRRVPAGRWGQPEDFGGLAVYLASDASAFHTGDTLFVDGGYAIY